MWEMSPANGELMQRVPMAGTTSSQHVCCLGLRSSPIPFISFISSLCFQTSHVYSRSNGREDLLASGPAIWFSTHLEKHPKNESVMSLESLSDSILWYTSDNSLLYLSSLNVGPRVLDGIWKKEWLKGFLHEIPSRSNIHSSFPSWFPWSWAWRLHPKSRNQGKGNVGSSLTGGWTQRMIRE